MSRKLGSMVSKWVITIVINGVYLGYNPLTNLLLTSWGILLVYTPVKLTIAMDNFPKFYVGKTSSNGLCFIGLFVYRSVRGFLVFWTVFV